MLRLRWIDLRAANDKKPEVSYRFNEQTCFASNVFTYVLQPSRCPRSVIDSTSRHASLQRDSLTSCNRQETRGQLSIQRADILRFKGIHLRTATVKKPEVSYRFNEQTCFASKTFTYVLQPSRSPRSVIDSTSRHASLQRDSLTYCNRQEARGQLSIQRADMLRFGGIHLRTVTVKKPEVSYR